MKMTPFVLSIFLPMMVHAAGVQTAQFKNQDHALTLEVLSDQIIHFDYETLAMTPETGHLLKTTPLVNQTTFAGPAEYAASTQGIETKALRVDVDATSLCFSLFDKNQQQMLTRACPGMNPNGNSMTLDPLQMQNVYGLGEQFQTPGVINGDWSGKIRTPGSKYGNSMNPFSGGNDGNAQFPILYALGPNSLNFALFLDTVYPYQWNFTKSPWKIDQTQSGTDSSFRGYFFAGRDLPELRSQYLTLVGLPPVPPKKAFGLWVSEFGYRNWKEIQDKIVSLRAHHFPIDGFVLDLYWFGQYIPNSTQSTMGMLQWDQKNFPNPAKQIASFDQNDGLGLMTIEESYVSSSLANYSSMANRGFFADTDAKSNQPTIYDSWWGKGAGIDWTNPQAGAAWANEHRKPQLTDLGITFHWTDLGEPEEYADYNFYQNPNGVGHTEADTHNLYNFFWNKSIADGYSLNHEIKRHFILTRSGTSGIERFGSAMWSGDIGPNMNCLSGTLNAQMHISLSGMDYFGSDVGGFMRSGLVGDPGQVYTRWFANSSLFDVPLRPHTDNGSKSHPTAPDRIGDLKSNLLNLRQRYELIPYYYSLAYQAHVSGQQVIPPLVYYYQNDQNVRQIADEKMIGADLLAATSANLSETARDVYLPAGDWVDYHTLKWFHSSGQTFANFNLMQTGGLQLPLFARAGAILPKAHIDDLTMNDLGKRTDGSTIDDLIVRVFGSTRASNFHLIEDDGVTESYQGGAFSDTLVSQNLTTQGETIRVAGSQGNYAGMSSARKNQIELVLEKPAITSVTLNGSSLQKFTDASAFGKATSGWMIDPSGVLFAKSDRLDVRSDKTFQFNY